MNLEDVIDPEYGLQQDEWSLSKPTFGKDNQLEVVGWSGKYFTNRMYILHCSECAKDAELFGSGYFKSLKSNLVKGQTPCGCSKHFRRTEAQWRVLLQRRSDEIGCKFHGFSTDFKGKRTKVLMECLTHGQWDCSSIDSILNQGTTNCPLCISAKTGERSKQDDLLAIEDFRSTGAYPEGASFWRSERKDKKGKKPYWFMYCPDCAATTETTGSSLKKGSIVCECSYHSQKYAYINLIRDSGLDIALKFGIANIPTRRAYEQDLRSALDVIQMMVWEFPTSKSCKLAENECKKLLDTPLLSRQDMPDGWSETTSLSNIEDIIKIYQNFGGILIFKSEE